MWIGWWKALFCQQGDEPLNFIKTLCFLGWLSNIPAVRVTAMYYGVCHFLMYAISGEVGTNIVICRVHKVKSSLQVAFKIPGVTASGSNCTLHFDVTRLHVMAEQPLEAFERLKRALSAFLSALHRCL
jgi:hypothetical protein